MKTHSLTFKVSAAQQVKEAFKEARDSLQEINAISLGQFIEYAQSNNSEYNSAEGFNHLRNVYYGRTADLESLRIIDQYKNDYTKS